MSSSLRLYLADGWPDRQRSCDWALVEAGRVVRRGCSASEHWPAADSTEAMLDPALVGCYLVKLPARAGGERFELAAYAYALEDQLLEDPDRYHFASGAESLAGTRVLAMARSRLATLLAVFDSLGRPPDRLVAAAELLPQVGDDWLLWQSPSRTLVLQAGRRGTCSVDSVADVGYLMAGVTPPPAQLQVIADHELATTVASGLPVVDGGSFDWAAADWESATELLVGDFRPRRDVGRWRRAVLWSAIALGLYTAVSLGEWATLAWRQDALKQDLQEIVRKALPGQPLVAPLSQLVSAADLQQHRRGEAGVGDFLVLAERAVGLAGGRPVQEINYQTGRLTMQMDSLDVGREKAMREALAMAGLELRVARQASAVRIAVAVDSGGEQP